MPHYLLKEQPRLPWKSAVVGDNSYSNDMNLSIILDQQGNVSFTNLDQVSGRVVLRCPKELPVDNIIVKLEGESRTRLLSPASTGDKQKPQLEYHKILYKIALVFPSPESARGRSNVGMGKNASTLGVGTHDFPFHFKLPFNNSCAHEMTKSPTMSVSGSGIEIAKPPTRHVKKTLPPTLSGFPGEAEIRYYVKATVTRHYFWQESIRAIVPFNFFPIEPPRPAPTGTEIYARQTHAFNQLPALERTKSKVKSLFSRVTEPSSPSTATSPTTGSSPTISIDARLPDPAILTCNEDIPLRLIMKKLSNFVGVVHLQSLQVALVGTTKIRAHDAYRSETSDWVIMSKSNMGMLIGTASDSVDTETVIDERLWRGQILPNTVAPSFQTCNIERTYQLDVRVGLSYTDAMQAAGAKPLSVILPLRLDLEIYSGIAPPKELLDAMAEAKASIRRRSTAGSIPSRKYSVSSIPPTTPIDDPSAGWSAMAGDAAQGSAGPAAAHPPQYHDAPPSYEDAIGVRLQPVNGERPQYVPPAVEDEDLLLGGGDEKRRFSTRSDS